MMDINGKTIRTGYAVYESYDAMNYNTAKKERVHKLVAIYDSMDEAMFAMRATAENHYDDPLEYNRKLIYKGRGIRYEYINTDTMEPGDYYDVFIKEVGIIL